MTDISGRVDTLEEQIAAINQSLLQRPDQASFSSYQINHESELDNLSTLYDSIKLQVRSLSSLYANLFGSVSTNYGYLTGHTGNTSVHYTPPTQVTITGDSTVSYTNTVTFISNTGQNILITLPANNLSSGNFYYFKKIDSYGYTGTITGSSIIDGSGYYDLASQYSYAILYSNGTVWYKFM